MAQATFCLHSPPYSSVYPRTRVFSSGLPVGQYHRGRRKWLVFASDRSSHSQPTDEGDRLRAEISPSVLQALQRQNASSSRNSSDESLIERNLRKRGGAQEASPAELPQENSSVSVSNDFTSSPPGKSFPSIFPATDNANALTNSTTSRYSVPVSSVLWQETPPGFDMEAYHNIDYYALYFRIGLLGMFLVQEGPEVLGGLETFFLLWLLVTMDAVPDDVTKAFLDQSTKLSDGDVNNFFEVIDTKDVISIVSEFFSYFWSSEAWTKRVETEKASQFVAAQVCSAYVCILSKFSDRFPRAEKKLEQYSLLLNESLTGLHGQLSDPLQIWDKALKDTPFTLAGTVYVKDYALIFPCKMKPMERRRDLGYVLEQVQNNLDKEFADSDLVALLERSLDSQEEFFVLIAPWYWVLTLDSKQFAPISRLLFILSCLATFNFTEAGVGFGFSWEPYVVPFGWAGILASLYFATGRRIPSVFPFPTIGAVGKKLSFDYGVVASRSSLISSIVQRACVLLFSSLLLFLVGFIFWGPSSYELTNVVDFKGYVLVPPDMFSYSSALTSLLQRASVATIQGEDGASKLAASPFAVAGLLGFNLMALTLVPGVHNDGGYLLNSLFRSKRLANQVKYACSVLVAISLCAKNPFLGLGWIAASSSFDVGCFVKDDVSDTDFIPTVSAALLLAAAIGCLIPFQ